MHRVAAFSFLLASVVLASCVGDEVPAGSGPPTDAGRGRNDDASTTGGAALPRIDRWDYAIDELQLGVSGCLAAIDQATSTMGGSYVKTAATDSSARAAARPGAATYAFCAANGASSLVVTAAFGLEGALDAQNDNARLFALTNGAASPPEPSPPSPNSTPLKIADGSGVPTEGLTQALCQERAMQALDAVFAGGPPEWSQTGRTFLAIGGSAGTTVAITCLAADLRAITINAVTIDPAVDPSALVSDVRAKLVELGSLGP